MPDQDGVIHIQAEKAKAGETWPSGELRISSWIPQTMMGFMLNDDEFDKAIDGHAPSGAMEQEEDKKVSNFVFEMMNFVLNMMNFGRP